MGGNGTGRELPRLAGRGDSGLDWLEAVEGVAGADRASAEDWSRPGSLAVGFEGGRGERKPPSCSAWTCCSGWIAWFCQHCRQTCRAFLIAVGIRIVSFSGSLVQSAENSSVSLLSEHLRWVSTRALRDHQGYVMGVEGSGACPASLAFPALPGWRRGSGQDELGGSPFFTGCLWFSLVTRAQGPNRCPTGEWLLLVRGPSLGFPRLRCILLTVCLRPCVTLPLLCPWYNSGTHSLSRNFFRWGSLMMQAPALGADWDLAYHMMEAGSLLLPPVSMCPNSKGHVTGPVSCASSSSKLGWCLKCLTTLSKHPAEATASKGLSPFSSRVCTPFHGPLLWLCPSP